MKSRDWVIAASAPWIAGQYPFKGEPTAFEWPVFLEGFNTVIRAGGGVSTRSADEWRQSVLVDFDEKDQKKGQSFFEIAENGGKDLHILCESLLILSNISIVFVSINWYSGISLLQKKKNKR